MTNFKNLTNGSQSSIKQPQTKAASITEKRSVAGVSAQQIAKAVKSDATSAKGGNGFKSFIKQ